MNTKEEIKEYIIRELKRVKDFPYLNYPTDLGKDFYIMEHQKIKMECSRHGRILSKIWVQQDDKLLPPDMPELMSDFIVNNPQFIEDRKKYDIDIFMNISQMVEFYTRWKNLSSLIKEKSDSFRPIFNVESYDFKSMYDGLSAHFDPKEQFHNFIFGQEIVGKIDFSGSQKQLAGIFYKIRDEISNKSKTPKNWTTFGTHKETFCFIRDNFTVKGKSITSLEILNCFERPEKFKVGTINFET
jgi:hypothetical protein